MNIVNKNNEIIFQSKRAKSITEIKKTPESVVRKYKNNIFAAPFIKGNLFSSMGDIYNKDICDLGCGEGELSCLLAKLGARVTAIDISPDLIFLAKRRSSLDDVSKKINFIVADIENYYFGEAKYDFIISYGFLHHTNVYRVFSNIQGVLKDNGKIIIIEPINSYSRLQDFFSRWSLGKKEISSNERPLNETELKIIVDYFQVIDTKYFHFIARISRIIPGQNLLDYGSKPTKIFLNILYIADWLILKIAPVARKYYRVIFIEARKK